MTLEDGMFLACDANVKRNIIARKNISSAVLGGEGLFNMKFTVERTTKTLMGSAVSGEGLVNVFRDTGRVLMSPVASTASLFEATNMMGAKAAARDSNTFGK